MFTYCTIKFHSRFNYCYFLSYSNRKNKKNNAFFYIKSKLYIKYKYDLVFFYQFIKKKTFVIPVIDLSLLEQLQQQ